MSAKYDCVCRLCLSSRGELLPIFPTTTLDDSGTAILASKIKDCVSVQINKNDELPTNVCKKCVDNVNNWHIFKSICEKTQNKLLSLKTESNQLEEIKVKNEPLSDEAYDDGVVIDGSYPDFEQNATGSHKLQPEGPPILASLGLTPRSDKKCVDPRLDWQRVHAILDLVQEDEVIDSLQSMEECDVLQQSDHESDTEAELLTDIEDSYIDCKNGYLTKDNRQLAKSAKLSSVNVKKPVKLLKRKNCTRHCTSVKSAWELFISEDMMELIVEATNENIANNTKGKSTNVKELKKLIGILYYHGVVRSIYPKRSDLWNNNFGSPSIITAMPHKRFEFLLQNLRFEKEQCDNILDYDVMKQMRKVFETFAHNCRTAFDINSVAIIDEIITPVSGPCPFKYNIGGRNIETGFKMVVVVDPTSFYVSNVDVVTDMYNVPEEIVKKSVNHLASTGRTIVMDSWYTSLSLINNLMDEYGLFSVGAINPNDAVLPPLFLSKHRPKCTFMTAFVSGDTTLSSYVNNKGKVLNVLTNLPKYYKRAHINHASVISMYKKNQSAVEVVDVLSHYYTTMQYSNNWTLSLFFTLLNIAGINAQVVWCYQKFGTYQRRTYLQDLALQLLSENKIASKNKKFALDLCLNITTVNIPVENNPAIRRYSCKICAKTTRKRRKTRLLCCKCGTPICNEHRSYLCILCWENSPNRW